MELLSSYDVINRKLWCQKLNKNFELLQLGNQLNINFKLFLERALGVRLVIFKLSFFHESLTKILSFFENLKFLFSNEFSKYKITRSFSKIFELFQNLRFLKKILSQKIARYFPKVNEKTQARNNPPRAQKVMSN